MEFYSGRDVFATCRGDLISYFSLAVYVHNVLVAIHGNIWHDPSYQVNVTTPGRIAGFVVDRPPVLSPADVNRLADWLCGHLSTTDW